MGDHRMSELGRLGTPEGRWEAAEVERLAAASLATRGVPQAQAVAEALVESSLAGVHTHGVRLLKGYLDELDRGVAAAEARPEVVSDSGPIALVDARGCLGVVAGIVGADEATERARRHGVGIVGVRSSNHFGAAGVYARRIARSGFVGLVTTSAAARVAAFGGTQPVLGTNPLAVAFDDFCADMATSQVCFGAVKERGRLGWPLPDGWASTGDGSPAISAQEATALAPLGGYKGQALGMVVSILTAVLVGGPLDSELEHVGESADGVPREIAHLLMAIDPERLGGGGAARDRLHRLLAGVRNSGGPRDERAPMSPGDRQRENRRRQGALGLELDDETRDLLSRLATGRTAR